MSSKPLGRATCALQYCAALVRARGRVLLAATAGASLLGIAINVVLAITDDDGLFPTATGRVFNVFCYFTVQSNLLVAVTSIMLLIRPDRESLAFRALRLTGVVAIVVTFVVFHTALSNLVELEGGAEIANQLVHTLAPILAVLTWLVVGPRGQADERVALWALAGPAAWVVFTLVRGELIDVYPYPFVDVNEHGYAQVALNIALVGVLFYALARGAVWLDRRLGRGSAVRRASLP